MASLLLVLMPARVLLLVLLLVLASVAGSVFGSSRNPKSSNATTPEKIVECAGYRPLSRGLRTFWDATEGETRFGFFSEWREI
jgi:hypothetical protein